MKVFISQPMNCKTQEEILKEREQAVSRVKCRFGEEVEVLDSYFEDYNPDTGCVPLKYLAKSLEILADADVAYFAEGWIEARGCRIENCCAQEYGIKIIDAEDWMIADETNCPKLGGELKNLAFGDALRMAKRYGKKIAREGWNGKNQFVELATCISYKNAAGEIINVEHDAIGNKALAFVGTSGVQIGWLASQADMLAEDWRIVD